MSLPVCIHVEHLGHLHDCFYEEILFASHGGEHTKLQLVLLASLCYMSDLVYMYICKKKKIRDVHISFLARGSGFHVQASLLIILE